MPPPSFDVPINHRLSLRRLTSSIAATIVENSRPRTGWAPDFPAEGDLAVARMVATSTNTLDVEGLRPWSGPWLIVEEGNVIGGVGFMGAPENGALEVGYGIVPSARGRGVATIAVAKLIELAGQAVPLIVAETTVTNVASHGVLRRLRFLESGRRFDKGDGDLIVWSRATFPGS